MSNVLAMDPTVDLWWTPKCDVKLPENEQLRIQYRHLTAREEAEFSDAQIKSLTKGKHSEYRFLMSSTDLKRCHQTIKGWENFTYPPNHPTKAGKAVPFTDENIDMLPLKIRSEFVDFLTGRDKDDEEGGTDLGEAKTE